MERATARRRLRAPLPVAMLALCPLLVVPASEMRTRDAPTRPPVTEFEFARLIYAENPEFARGFAGYRWMTDAPEAETHLLQGIRRLTRVDTASEGTAIRLDNDAIFDHPFLYGVEVG